MKFFKSFLSITTCLIFILPSVSAQAESPYGEQSIVNRIKQLETQINTLNRAVYRGETPLVIEKSKGEISSQDSRNSVTGIASFETRVSQLEQSQRILTGQLEEVLFEIKKLKDNFKLMKADTEQRFQNRTSKSVENNKVVLNETAPEKPVFFNKAEDSNLTSIEGYKQKSLGVLSSSDEGHSGRAESMYEKAFSNIKDANYDTAEKEFKLFLKDFPRHPLAPNSQYWLGETYYVRGDYKEAAKTFAQGYQNFPKSSKAQDSLLKLAFSLSRMGRIDDACLSLRQLQKEFADNKVLQKRALKEISRLSCG